MHTACAQFSVYPSQFSESATRKYCASVTFRWRLKAVISRQPDQMYYFFGEELLHSTVGGGVGVGGRMGAHEGSIENPPTVRASHQVYGQPSRTDKKVKIVYCLLSKHFRGLS